MREIEFRAWHNSSKEMVYFKDSKIDQYKALHLWDLINGNHPDGSLMQYTGLKDKNGKKIFEGDIVERRYDTHLADVNLVKWHEENLQWILLRNGIIDWLKEDPLEIIGNIHENPELLK